MKGVMFVLLVLLFAALFTSIGLADAQAVTFLDQVASELGTIETDVRDGVMPGLAGIMLALVTISVGVAVIGYFTRGR